MHLHGWLCGRAKAKGSATAKPKAKARPGGHVTLVYSRVLGRALEKAVNILLLGTHRIVVGLVHVVMDMVVAARSKSTSQQK